MTEKLSMCSSSVKKMIGTINFTDGNHETSKNVCDKNVIFVFLYIMHGTVDS